MDEKGNIDFENTTMSELFSNEIHGRNMYRYCEKFAKSVMPDGKKDEEKFVSRFHRWLKKKKHKKMVREKAHEYITNYISDKAKQMNNINTYVQVHIKAFETIGISFKKKFKKKIKEINEKVWSRRLYKRHVETTKKKHDSIKFVTKVYKEMAHATIMIEPSEYVNMIDDFKNGEHVVNVEKEQLNTFLNHCNKVKITKDEIFAYQMKMNAYILYSVSLGIRSGHFVGESIKNITPTEDNDGILQRYFNGKSGKRAKCGVVELERLESYTRVAFGKTLENDPLVSLGLYIFFLAHVMFETPMKPFLFGSDESKPKERYMETTMKRIRALSNISAQLVGAERFGFRGRKTHLFRSVATSILTTKGCSDTEIENHLGWKHSIKNIFYAVPEEVAMANKCSFIMAGRTGKDDPYHPAFDKIGDVDESLLPEYLMEHNTLKFFGKIAIIAIAMGKAPPYMMKKVSDVVSKQSFKDLQRNLEAYCSSKLRFVDATSNKNKREREMKEKIIELETQLAIFKRQKVEEIETPSAALLISEIDKLKGMAKEENFPDKCLDVFVDKMYGIIEVISINGSFGVQMKKAEGKALRKMLKLSAAKRNGIPIQRKNPKSSWLEYANKELGSIMVSSWPQYKKDYGF